jgi:hypothetical protein
MRLSKKHPGYIRRSSRALLLAVVFAALACTAIGNVRQQESILAVKNFEVTEETEVGLEIEALSPGASWATKDAEAAALVLEVDGDYNQDLLLWAGNSPFIYRVMLGRLAPGKHSVTARMNHSRSAAAARQAIVRSLRPILYAGNKQLTADDLLALAHSPVLYQRANTIDRFSDVPLLMYYEVTRTDAREVKIRYTVIFTNEDGGTPTAALMARWGRGTDIEWVYELSAQDGRVIEESYQGVEHETRPFKGKRTNGSHPLLSVASDNNNFSDLGSSVTRFALLPIAADLHSASRESIMDAHPWTYRIMAEELTREGRIKEKPADINSISDPRNYLYVDLYAQQRGAAISVEVASAVEPKTSTSDLDQPKLRIERSGYSRTAVRLGSAAAVSSASSITIHCQQTQPAVEGRACQVLVVRTTRLDRNYEPRQLKAEQLSTQTIKPGETMVVRLSH